MTQEKKVQFKDIYQELRENISVDAMQKKDFGDRAEGFKIGYLIERLNDVVANHGCSWEVTMLPMGHDEQGNPIVYRLIELGAGDRKKTTAAINLQLSILGPDGTILAKRTSFGGCQVLNNSLGDTLKGAQTDALKKAMGQLGLGNAAYKGVLDEHLQEFKYRRYEIMDKIEKFFSKSEIKITKEKGMKLISKISRKHYNGSEDVSYEDWLKIEAFLNEKLKEKKKTKKVKDEPKNTDGEDTPKTDKKQVDNKE